MAEILRNVNPKRTHRRQKWWWTAYYLSSFYLLSIYISICLPYIWREKEGAGTERRERKLGILLQANLCFISFIAHQYSITWMYHNFSVSYLAFFQDVLLLKKKMLLFCKFFQRIKFSFFLATILQTKPWSC